MFWAIVFLAGAIRPGYSFAHDFISDLSLGQQGWIERTNIGLLGVAELPLIVLVWRRPGRDLSTALAWLLSAAAAGAVAMAIFPSFHHQPPPVAALHIAAFLIAAISLLAAAAVAPLHPVTKERGSWFNRYCRASVGMGLLLFAVLCFHVLWVHTGGASILTAGQGLLERATGLALTSWLVPFAYLFVFRKPQPSARSPGRRSWLRTGRRQE